MAPNRPQRLFLHADMDAFYASVEQRDRPELRGQPVLVAFDAPRSVVTTASYEARPFGVGSAMPLATAKQRCPQALIVAPRLAHYRDVSAQIFGIFHRYAPLVQGLSLDEAFLDITGTERVHGTVESLVDNLRRDVWNETQLTVSVGVADSMFVAKVASDLNKPNGSYIVPPGTSAQLLAPMPIERLWGVGKKTALRLRDLGLFRIGDVAEASPDWLRRTLGSQGPLLGQLARGFDEREVIPDRDPQSVGAEHTLQQDVVRKTEIWPWLIRAADEVSGRLRAQQLLAGGLRLKLKTAAFAVHGRQHRLVQPTASAADLLSLARTLLDDWHEGEPVRLVGLTAYDLRAANAPTQLDLFAAPAVQQNHRLDAALDALRQRFGEAAVVRGSALGVHEVRRKD